MSVKEPEAKTADATMLKGRKLANLLHGLVAAYGDDAGTDEFPELAEEWVSKKDAVAFAEARVDQAVKEATDKLKHELTNLRAEVKTIIYDFNQFATWFVQTFGKYASADEVIIKMGLLKEKFEFLEEAKANEK